MSQKQICPACGTLALVAGLFRSGKGNGTGDAEPKYVVCVNAECGKRFEAVDGTAGENEPVKEGK